jgi:hypothetical protein
MTATTAATLRFCTLLRPSLCSNVLMPPQPGMFPVPYGSAHTHNHTKITTALPSSTASVPPIGPGMPGGPALLSSKMGAISGPHMLDREYDVPATINEDMFGASAHGQPHPVHQLPPQTMSHHPNSHSHRDSHPSHSLHQPTAGPSSRHGVYSRLQ